MRRGGIIDRATRIVLSDELRKTLGHPYKRFVFFRFLKRKIGDRYTPRDQGPLPPPELIVNEALMHEDDLRIQARPETYFGSGFLDAWTVLTMLDACSFDLGSLRSVLAFGSGTGRVIRHFRNIDGCRLEWHTGNPKPNHWLPGNILGIALSYLLLN